MILGSGLGSALGSLLGSGRYRIPVVGFAIFVGAILGQFGCATAFEKSLGTRESQHSKIFVTDMDLVWASSVESLKSYPIEINNREGGFLQTQWVENTQQRNFSDTYGSGKSTYHEAQLRYKVWVSQGFHDGEPSVKVSIQKEQVVKRDILEGFKPVETEPIEERSLLYRISRIVEMRAMLAKLEKERIDRELKTSGSGL